MASAHRVPIGDRIRQQRRSAGVTQRALASAVGVSPAYLSLIESDKRQIGGRLLHRIADRLGVSPDTFTQLRDDRLAGELAEVARTLDVPVQKSSAELVAFSTEWARILLALHDRALTAEARAFRLADRFARDPQWTSFAHDILSRITSIRSAAEILADLGPADEPHRARFVATLTAESARLSGVARDMIEALQTGTAVDAAGADVREADAFLQDRGYHFAELERAADALGPAVPRAAPPGVRFAAACAAVRERLAEGIEAVLSSQEFRTATAAERARGALVRYAAGAVLMPKREFHAAAEAARYDLDVLCARFSASIEQVAHRLAALGNAREDGVPFAFLRVDPAGTVSKRLSTAALRLPLFGACPLWVVYEAFAQPDRTLSQLVDLDGERFLFIARVTEKAPRRHAQPPIRFAILLGVEARHCDRIVYGDAFASERESLVTFAGYECLSCKRVACAQRTRSARVG